MLHEIAVEFRVGWDHEGDGGAYMIAPADCPRGLDAYGHHRHCLDQARVSECQHLETPIRTEVVCNAEESEDGTYLSINFQATRAFCAHPAWADTP